MLWQNLSMSLIVSYVITGRNFGGIDDYVSYPDSCFKLFVTGSPEMDYKGPGNIFKGVASSGAWVCFAEFNRLVPEVLSVCTVQYKAVCDGMAASAVRVRVEGDEIKLDRTCGAFITMNPGYLGRSELPEGLKALFRPMTVMVPDLILICENMLMAEGFVTAKGLASKFFCLYSLLKALLPLPPPATL
jgi:dynein heavy chain, axonemal